MLRPSGQARVLPVDPQVPDERAVEAAVEVLRSGGLVGLPTETVYGLAARALDPRALARVFSAKGRPTSHPLIAHVSELAEAQRLAAAWPEAAALLAGAFWPGPLTLVVTRASHVPAEVGGGGPSVAVRAPAHPVARAVIAALGEPVAAPSANRYQGLSPTEAAHVVQELGDAVDLVLDAGPCEAGIESTVVDVRAGAPRVLRPGALGIARLRSVVPDIVFAFERLQGEEVRASPGMQDRHYAPRATLLLEESAEQATTVAVSLVSRGKRVGLVLRGLVSPAPGVLVRVLPDDVGGYAHALYGTLRALDDAGATSIVVARVPEDDSWLAVADRLARAAAKA